MLYIKVRLKNSLAFLILKPYRHMKLFSFFRKNTPHQRAMAEYDAEIDELSTEKQNIKAKIDQLNTLKKNVEGVLS